MTDRSTRGRQAFGDIAPGLAAYTDEVLFDDVWQRPGLAPRDRSLITVATLVALYRINELPTHLRLAQQNGVTRDELTELNHPPGLLRGLADRSHGHRHRP